MINQDQILSAARWAAQAMAVWLVNKGVISSDLIPLVVGVVLALVSLCWGLWAHTASSTVKAAAATEGVQKIVMDSQQAADKIAPKDASGTPQPDKVLSPSEDLSHVAAQPGVVAVVLQDTARAAANPSKNVVGLVAVPEVAKVVK